MTQLLISVKNAAEALLALDAGADIIDLKDPNIGALGALNLAETKQIVLAINGGVQLSATVGENHASLEVLIEAIETRADMGVDMIKIVASAHFYADDFVQKMQVLTKSGVKIVAVFFADEVIDYDLLEKIKQAGFCGVMLDTKTKQQNLLQMQTKDDLQKFTQSCHQHQLKFGLAGSLRPQHIVFLVEFNPTYIGFRGGVCDDLMRKSDLNRAKAIEVKELLRQHNKINAKAQKSWGLALHS
jgi:uncharacterized protein (UPF0264 family)